MKYLDNLPVTGHEHIYTLDSSRGSSDISSLILSHNRKIPFRKST